MNFKHIQHHATAAICALLFGLTFLLATAPARAQDETAQIEIGFKKLSAEEEAKLRAVLAEPTRRDATSQNLKNQLDAKLQAALKLGEFPAVLAAHKEAAELLPDGGYPNIYAWRLFDQGDISGGLYWRQRALERSTTYTLRAIILVNMAIDFYNLNRVREAYQKLNETLPMLGNITNQAAFVKRDTART
ncbi:MAG: hypothetical protein RL761_55, partial [Pseudomonadota bacterium]